MNVEQCSTNERRALRDADAVANDERAEVCGDSRRTECVVVCASDHPIAPCATCDGRTALRMNCDRCPHMAKIINAMRPCQNCEAGKLHGEVHVSGWSADKAHAQRVISDHTSSTGVTALDPDAEDALRKAMATLFALDPVELLLVQHVMRGGSYASFGAPLLALSRRLRTKERELDGRKDGFRQLAKTWADSVADKMPQMRDVLRARIDG